MRSWSLIFVCMDYFCDRVPCQAGQTSVILSLRGPVVGVCMHARVHTGLRTHVTLSHSKGQKSTSTQTVLAHQRQVLLVCSNTPRGDITGKANHDTVPRTHLFLPPCVVLCNSHSARTPCVPQPLSSHPVVTVSYVAALMLLASSAAGTRLSKPKTPRLLGDILSDWGLNRHSVLWSGC